MYDVLRAGYNLLRHQRADQFDIRKAKQFVSYWSVHYHYKIKDVNNDKVIDYLKELDFGNKLSAQNVKRLLRWKDPRMLTEEKMSGQNAGDKNVKVVCVLEKLGAINDFRLGKMRESSFKAETNGIFPNGIIWQIFLFHVARPFEYPMADQNVFRAFSIHKKTKIPKNWEDYLHYVDYFFEVAAAAEITVEKAKGNGENINDIVFKLKKVDNALLIFGRFLKKSGELRY